MSLIPPQGLIREEFWKTKEDVQAVVMGAYESFAQMDEQLFKYGEIRADMVVGDYNQSWDEQRIARAISIPTTASATGRILQGDQLLQRGDQECTAGSGSG